MDTFASVWDAADGVEADQSLASLTAARIQVTPVWSFLAVAKSPEEFQHRFALVEDRVRESADDHGVDFAILAKSLVDDFRATAAFYVKDGDKEVGGPYDSKSDAQDAISGGDVTGDDLSVSGSGDNDDDGNDSDGDGKDEDEDSSDDGDDDSGNDDDPDDDASDDDGKGDNPFAKKKASLDPLPIFTLAGNDGLKYGTCANCGDTNTKVTSQSTDKGSKWVGTDCSCKKKAAAQPAPSCGNTAPHAPHEDRVGFGKGGSATRTCQGVLSTFDYSDRKRKPNRLPSSNYSRTASLQVVAYHTVVHQPGETVFVDHFMGHDEHEGRKGVWAQVVASPGQHGHADREDSHLLKPMAPGGTHFFHHFGSLEKVAHPGLGMGADEEWDDEDDKPTMNRSNFDGDQHRFDYYADHEPHSEDNYGDPYGRSERRHESSLQTQASPACPSCGGATKERGMPTNPQKSGIQCTDSKGVGCGARNTVIPKHKFPSKGDGINLSGSQHTALADGEDPLALVISTVPGGEGQAEAEAHHQGATASLVARFASLYNEFVTE